MSTSKAIDDVKTSEGVRDTYRTPKVVPIGKAVDLLQGSSGKHTDGSTGWYWNEEG
jgi:hypothetical protein